MPANHIYSCAISRLFSGVTSERHALFKQTASGFTWKQPEAIALTPSLIGMFLPLQMSQNENSFSLILTLWMRLVWLGRFTTFLLYLITILPACLLLHSSTLISLPLSLIFPSGSVPTVPPGNVQGEPVNSTTVRFTWSAPSPQFINGINQGYKVGSSFLSTGAL